MNSEPSSQQTQWPRKALQAPRSSPSIGDRGGLGRPGGPQLMGCCCNPTTRCGDWLIHTRPARVSLRYVLASYGRGGAADARTHGRIARAHAEIPWAPRGGGRGTTAQMRGPTPSNGMPDGRLERPPRGCHHGGEEYSNRPFCPPGTAIAIHPETHSGRAIRDFPRTCVWRNLSATTVVQQGPSRGADVTTTADSATITAQDRPQGRPEPVHAMSDATNPEGHKRSLPGRPPGIRADSSGLTDRQRRVIEVIRDSVQRRGYPPSMREIGQAVGLSSTSSVAHQLMALERKGFLRRDPHRPRACEVRGSDQAASAQRPRTPRASPPRRTFRSSGASPPVVRSSPRSPSRTSSPCRGNWSVTASCSS